MLKCNRCKRRCILGVDKVAKFMIVKGDRHFRVYRGICREFATTVRLNSHDLRKNVINILRDGMIRTEIAHLYKISVSAVKYSLRQSQKQGKAVFKIILGPSVKKLTHLPVTLNCNSSTRVRRRAMLRKKQV